MKISRILLSAVVHIESDSFVKEVKIAGRSWGIKRDIKYSRKNERRDKNSSLYLSNRS